MIRTTAKKVAKQYKGNWRIEKSVLQIFYDKVKKGEKKPRKLGEDSIVKADWNCLQEINE